MRTKNKQQPATEAHTARRNPHWLQCGVRLLANLQSVQESERQLRHATNLQVGVIMRTARLESGLSLRETSRRLKISAPYLGDIEAGKRGASIEWLHKLAAALKQPNGQELRRRP